MTLIFIALAIFALAGIFAGLWWYQQQTPSYTLNDANTTPRNIDWDKPPPDSEPASPPPQSDLIIALYLRASETPLFQGQALVTACQQVGLKFGDMDIFHHYGPDKDATDAPVFSLANLHEPGKFEPDHFADFETDGLIAFMQLPGPLSGRVAFELMLNAVQRLAETLGGSLEDEQRQPIDTEALAYIRDSIHTFETGS